MGFDGKTLVHPSQVEPTNRIWAPTGEQVDHAARVIAAFEEAEAEGRGVVTVDGRKGKAKPGLGWGFVMLLPATTTAALTIALKA
jgi:citrate lyase beta subunit